ncbi:MAG: hypothetical protein GF398_10170 [Chitinivibrionales bacterium]|nr:hypothetical protein [Chitinivibrionales bacterium]
MFAMQLSKPWEDGMNDQDCKDTARQVISSVLENAAFIFADPMEAGSEPQLDSWQADGVALEFKGSAGGAMHMWAGSGFSRYAAANMLGVEEDDENASRKGLDALKEILNMIVGNLLTEVYGSEPVYDLSIPRTLDKQELATDYGDPQAVWLEAEGNQVLFVLRTAQA